jgi:hypothetical protein
MFMINEGAGQMKPRSKTATLAIVSVIDTGGNNHHPGGPQVEAY